MEKDAKENFFCEKELVCEGLKLMFDEEVNERGKNAIIEDCKG